MSAIQECKYNHTDLHYPHAVFQTWRKDSVVPKYHVEHRCQACPFAFISTITRGVYESYKGMGVPVRGLEVDRQ